ncbi:MAG: hypothetical protein HY894_07960 [Deltaproteobacteria bacterium]|nr:hypothetical protein [Deltaproteobacteria bacterium]
MGEAEIKELAKAIAEELRGHQPTCHLAPAEQEAVRDLLKTKKKAVKAALFVFGAVVLWILKDAYLWVVSHLAFR